MNPDLNWTVAYRRLRPRPEPVFHRVELSETWHTASGDVYRAYVEELGDDHEVWYVPNRASELTEYVAREDVMNVLMCVDGPRIPIADDGEPIEMLRARGPYEATHD